MWPWVGCFWGFSLLIYIFNKFYILRISAFIYITLPPSSRISNSGCRILRLERSVLRLCKFFKKQLLDLTFVLIPCPSHKGDHPKPGAPLFLITRLIRKPFQFRRCFRQALKFGGGSGSGARLILAHSFFHRLFSIHGGVEDTGDLYPVPLFNVIRNVMCNWKRP